MNIQVDISLRNGAMDTVALEVPSGAVRVDALLPPMQKLFDRLVAIELANVQVSCAKGCSVCCRQLIPLSLAEVFYLYDLIRSLPEARRKTITEKIQHTAETVKQRFNISGLHDIYRAPDFEQRYFDLGIFCPFLEDGACSIYPQRPLVCRDYNVSSPASLCKEPYTNEPERIKMSINFGALMSVFCGRLYGLPPLPIPMFHCIEWMHENAEFLKSEKPSQWLIEALLNGITKVEIKGSSVKSLNWKYLEAGETESVAKTPPPVSEVNRPDEKGISPLFSILSRDDAASRRSEIEELLRRGAVIKSGAIPAPAQEAKRLTRQASAENIKKIFHRLVALEDGIGEPGLFVEIGAGDGYLRYLMSLADDPVINQIAGKLVETEPSSEVVGANRVAGKLTICLGIAGLPGHFGESFTLCVVSMNVLDIFSRAQIQEHLQTISRILKPGGLVVHIMSSAIHRRVFIDLAKSYPDSVYLPYYRNGRVGLRIVPNRAQIADLGASVPEGPEALAELFAMDPDAYIRLAEQFDRRFDPGGGSYCVPLDRFSADKMLSALQASGYCILMNEEIHSRVVAPRTELHSEFADLNGFHNSLGALIVSKQEIAPGLIAEESTFRALIAKKD